MNPESAKHETTRKPARTCVGCRRQGGRDGLVRLVAAPDGRLAIDPRARNGGRGAWVHPARTCIEGAVKRHAAERSLGLAPVRDLSADVLVTALRTALERKVASLLGVGARTRILALGADAVAESLERDKVGLVLVAADAGSVAAALCTGEPGTPRTVKYSTKMGLGTLFGRGEVSLLAVREGRNAAELDVTIDRLAGLED